MRAELAIEAEAWKWSSAAAHCGGETGNEFLDLDVWRSHWPGSTWRQYLAAGEMESKLAVHAHGSAVGQDRVCTGPRRIDEAATVATNETADKSVAAIVNQRTPEAPSNFGKTVDLRLITATSPCSLKLTYAADPASMRRGKIVLGRLQALLQQELGANPRVFLPSIHLRSQPLLDVAATIWQEQ